MKYAPLSVEAILISGNDLSVVNAARVSFSKESKELDQKDVRLIHYLAEHEHTSPFNHAFLSFRVKAPIFVARQLVKHKFLPWNEVSRRYVDDEPEFYMPDTFRKRSEDRKQGSADEPVWGYASVKVGLNEVDKFALQQYNEAIKMGVAPEQARMFLPLNTMTEWIWSGTLGAWLNMLKLRLTNDSQKETREVANMIATVVAEHFPNSYNAIVQGG